MVLVEFLGPISREPVKIDVKSLMELRDYLIKDASLKEWLLMSAVSVNGVIALDLNCPLKSGDKVAILPPVCGG